MINPASFQTMDFWSVVYDTSIFNRIDCHTLIIYLQKLIDSIYNFNNDEYLNEIILNPFFKPRFPKLLLNLTQLNPHLLALLPSSVPSSNFSLPGNEISFVFNWSQKLKKDPKIKSKSKVRIEESLVNKSCSTAWVDPKSFYILLRPQK